MPPSSSLLRFVYTSILNNNFFLGSFSCSVFLYAVLMTVKPVQSMAIQTQEGRYAGEGLEIQDIYSRVQTLVSQGISGMDPT